MRSVAQSVQDKVIESAKKVSRLFGYGTEISEIGGITKSESQDGSGAMVCRDRDYFQAEKIERAVDCVHFHAGQRADGRRVVKNISELAAQRSLGFCRRIDRNDSPLL